MSVTIKAKELTVGDYIKGPDRSGLIEINRVPIDKAGPFTAWVGTRKAKASVRLSSIRRKRSKYFSAGPIALGHQRD